MTREETHISINIRTHSARKHRHIRPAAVLALVALAMCGRGHGGPRAARPPSANKLRRSVARLIRRLGSDDEGTRDAAAQTLIRMGPPAAPLLAACFRSPNPKTISHVRDVLNRIAPDPSPTAMGLKMSAVVAGPRPEKGQVVTLWIKLTNTSKKTMIIFQSDWELAVQAVDEAKFPSVGEKFRNWKSAGMTEQHVLKLGPGETAGYLMDAEPVDPTKAPTSVRARLRAVIMVKSTGVPADELKVAPAGEKGEELSAQPLRLSSSPIQITYAPEPAGWKKDADALLAAYFKESAIIEDAVDKLYAAFDDGNLDVLTKLIGAERVAAMQNAKNFRERYKIIEKVIAELDRQHSNARRRILRAEQLPRILRRGLRRGKGSERRRTLGLLSEYTEPHRVAEDVIGFLSRHGPRQDYGMMMHILLVASDKAPTRKEQWGFIRSIVLVSNHYYYTFDQLQDRLGSCFFPDELAWAARIVDAAPEKKVDAYSKRFLAWQLFTHRDPKLHDPQRAARIAAKFTKQAPNDKRAAFVAAMIQGKRDVARRIAEQNPKFRNSLAWVLATADRLEPQDYVLAVELAKKAVVDDGGIDAPEAVSSIDTLACAYAKTGDYAKALEAAEKAWANVDKHSRSARTFSYRLARFLGAANTDAETRKKTPSHIAGQKARDALVARLKAEKNHYLCQALIDVLRESFPNDAAARKACADNATKADWPASD